MRMIIDSNHWADKNTQFFKLSPPTGSDLTDLKNRDTLTV